MSYEIRVHGQPVATCETSDEALEHVRTLIQSNPDAEPEVFDTTTGKPFEPAASKGWREHLTRALR